MLCFRPAVLATAGVAVGCLIAGCGGESEGSGQTSTSSSAVSNTQRGFDAATERGLAIRGLRVTPSVVPESGSRLTTFAVSFRAREAIGQIGKARRSYVASARGPSDFACVFDAEFPSKSAQPGDEIQISLDPSRMKGRRWCRGDFAGKIYLAVDFACPAKGVCHVPSGFPRQRIEVGGFEFSVR
jgi:hypothetical protein